MAKQRILVVDDEEIVTTTLKTLFDLETNYSVRTGNNPVAALKELKKKPVDLVIADFVMPEMNGIDFLREARELYPEVPLILLTGYADKESAIQAINEIGLYQYLEKPWDNQGLLLVVKNGLEKRSLLAQLRRKVEELRVSNEKLKEAYDEVMRTQEELLRADRMATIGRVSERVADEMLMHMPALDLVQDIIDRYPEDEFLQQTAGAVKQAAPGVPVIGAGRIPSIARAEAVLQEGGCDLVAVARALYCDPELWVKTREGRRAEIIPCDYCNRCLDHLRAGRCYCAKWPEGVGRFFPGEVEQ